MGIVNTRNAVLGWTVWKIGKRVIKRKAKEAIPGTVEGSKRPNKSAIAAAVAAAVGAAMFWRSRAGDGDESGGDTSE
jgi:hypothetical protein